MSSVLSCLPKTAHVGSWCEVTEEEMETMALREFYFWLVSCEEKLHELKTNRPSTRLSACQLLASLKDLQRDFDKGRLPDEVYTPDYDEDEDDENCIDRGDVIRRFRGLGTAISDNMARMETLCVCWDKLNADMNELTKALSTGGAGKLTVEKLESSISHIKNMFKERANIIESMAEPSAYED